MRLGFIGVKSSFIVVYRKIKCVCTVFTAILSQHLVVSCRSASAVREEVKVSGPRTTILATYKKCSDLEEIISTVGEIYLFLSNERDKSFSEGGDA